MNGDLHPSIVPFDVAAQWPEPDMSIIQPDRTPAPEMTGEEFAKVFGPWAGWLQTAATAKGTHVDFVSLALLSTASAAIGNSRWVVPWEDWKEPPILWAMLVGDPSSGKSPALDAILDPIKEIDAELARDYQTARTDWEAKDEIAKIALGHWKSEVKAAISEDGEPPEKPVDADAGKPPIRERIRISDATTEKVAELLSATWRGLLLTRDELSGWLGSMDRYNGGGDRPFWLEANGGRSYVVDRKSSPEPITVDHLAVSVLGGTQPAKLDSLLVKTDDDGLLARFLVVFPDPIPLTRPTVAIDAQACAAAFKRLRTLQAYTDENGDRRPFFVHLNNEAQDLFQDFRAQCQAWEGDANSLMKSHIGKLPGYALRVALVLAHLDWAMTGDAEPVSMITAAHINRACHYVGEHLRSHAHRAYGCAMPPAEVRNARRIAEIILIEGLERFKVRDIQHRGRTGLAKSAEIKAALDVLQDAGWLSHISEKTAGRPRVCYAVNPKLEGTN